MPNRIEIEIAADAFRKKLNIKDGKDGELGPIGPIGLSGNDGKRGPKGEKGTEGKRGPKGPKGASGDQGENGQDGSLDTPIEIVEKINTLPLTSPHKIDASHIKNLPIIQSGGNERRPFIKTVSDTASVDLAVSTGGNLTATVLPAGVDHGGLAGLADNDHTQYVNAVSDTASLDLTLAGQSISGVVLPAGVDHGALAGLVDDDHTQYALLAGRAGGQILIGGTAATNDLTLRTTSGVGAAGADMIFQVGNNGATEAMRILNSGFVGIGMTNPIVGLEVGNVAGTFPALGIAGSLGGTLGVGGVAIGRIYLQGSSQADFLLDDTGAGLNLKMFQFINDDGVWRIRSLNDDGSVKEDPILSCSSTLGSLGVRTLTPGVINGVSLSTVPIHALGGNIVSDHTTNGSFLMNSRNFALDSRLIQMTWLSTGLTFRTINDDGSLKATLTTLDSTGRLGIGVTSPTAFIHLKAGTATASTAPLKFNSGTLLTTAEAGAVEFLTDKFYGTITTGAARAEFTLNNAALTSGKIPIATTNGRLTDGQTPLTGTKVYYVSDTSGGAVTRKLTFIDGILTAEV